MAPEALGLGYEAYDVVEQSDSPAPPATLGPVVIGNTQALVANTPETQVPKITSEWARLSDKETASLAARKALRLWFSLVGALILIGCLLGYRGWGWRLVEWVYQFPAPTR